MTPPQIFSSAAMEEGAECRKRKEHDGGGGEGAKAARIIPAVADAEGDVEMEEDAMAEVMKWLEEDMVSAALPHSPSSPSYRQETSFVTINGNEESCGPSFSSSASTVMASVDTGGVVPYFVGCPSDRAAPLIPVARAAGGCGATTVEEEEEVEWVAGGVGGREGTLEVEESRV